MWRDPSGLRGPMIPWRPPGCAPPQGGRKDPLPWWRRMSCPIPGMPPIILVVPDVLIGPVLPWWPAPPRPSGPTPPGYDPANPGWRPGYPEGPTLRPPRWFDPEGGEWRFHPPDQWHPDPHWDHNPWDQWNGQWRNIPMAKNEGQPMVSEPAERVAASVRLKNKHLTIWLRFSATTARMRITV